ncbi:MULTISPECIES: deoxyguanosinetriphosphate triphosphohydrolase [unclassified Kitasatospora]|uniref:deoxyguanosinetriphosphate triphosphohydrolase n=1 Tax=unclassified Kitasatospora TaxID=2633591 RepID=UPI00070BABF4|nr:MULTISPECIES: deoxyguanosinetriphosphate triphosphohydrolase [unclassified Kitasatospora]KQV05568.1 deoxyguanosinetriphosphate triphosphohydrolase [Kitasatospora sp. Root107]KRB62370.1 deoxyguanosinetriphosphate triphosphohydrolase [Kitasatospora sp. Root187]
MNDTTYDPAAEARWVPEPDKRPGRTAFQRDRARVLHSAALRRLAGTTQVVAPMRSDFPRTRLTHSLECAQVGRELGAALGCDPDLVETGCLAHDIGHPPFGHTGEEALDQAAESCGGFEGNAQSLRILTRLEPKRFAPLDEEPARLAPWPGRSVGLNLTRAALDSATKYPWPRGSHPTDPGSTKYGVYGDDLPVFRWLRTGAPADRKCFEATVMDWSDDVAYSTHDVEDGIQAGHIDLAALRAAEERTELFKIAERYAEAEPEEFGAALDRLQAEEWWPRAYDGSARARAGLKDLTSKLIGRFCLSAEQATRARYGPGPLTRYAAELVVPAEVRIECAVLKAVAVRYVMQRDEQAQLRSRQRIVIAELAETLTRTAPYGLDPVFAALYEEAEDDRAALRAVIDQIATLTDASALALHGRLVRPGP